MGIEVGRRKSEVEPDSPTSESRAPARAMAAGWRARSSRRPRRRRGHSSRAPARRDADAVGDLDERAERLVHQLRHHAVDLHVEARRRVHRVGLHHRGPVARRKVRRTCAACVVLRVGQQDVGLVGPVEADATLGQPPLRPHRRRAEAVVRLVPLRRRRGQYCARSTMIGTVDCTAVETAASASARRLERQVDRQAAVGRDRMKSASPRPRSPAGRSASTVAAVAPGLASSMNVVKKRPVAPSARNQLVDGAFTPADSWPPLKNRACRSTSHARRRRGS